MRRQPPILIFTLLLITTLMVGCDAAVDCLDSDGPKFESKTINDPTLNQEYTGTIRVSINNEPQDDRFGYEFKITGQLPTGLQSQSRGRDFFITGTATELGTFSFNVFVRVLDPAGAENSGLCYTTRSQDFQFTVQQQP